MNLTKLPDKAQELQTLIEEGDDMPETVAVVYTAEIRKQIRKRVPLLNDHLDTVDEKLQALLEAQDDLFHELNILAALSELAAGQEAVERATAEVEVVDAHPLPESEE